MHFSDGREGLKGGQEPVQQDRFSQGARIVGLGVREMTQFVHSVCTVLIESFGGPHTLRMLFYQINVSFKMFIS